MAFYHYLIENQRVFSSYRPRVEFRALKLQNCLCVKEIAVDQVAIGAPVIHFLSHHKERIAIVAPITEACAHCLKSVDRSGKIKLLFVLGAMFCDLDKTASGDSSCGLVKCNMFIAYLSAVSAYMPQARY